LIVAMVDTPYPSPFSNGETIVVTLMSLAAALMWTIVLASFCDIATNSNPEKIAFRQTLDDLNTFMADQHLPNEMRVRLRRYFHQRKSLQMMKAAGEVVGKLSSSLQTEVVMHCHGYWLTQVRFLRQAEPGCLVQIARAMIPIVFSPTELTPVRHLYVLRSGIVLHGSKVITSGRIWGEDVVMTCPEDEFSVPSRCMTFVEVLALSHQKLMVVISSFSMARKLVRKAEIRYAILRGIRRIVRQARAVAEQTEGKKKSRDFVAALIDASTNQARKAIVNGTPLMSIDTDDAGQVGSPGVGFTTESRILQIHSDVKELQKQSNKRLSTLERGVQEILQMLGSSQGTSPSIRQARTVSSGSGLVAAAQSYAQGKDNKPPVPGPGPVPAFSRSSSFGAKQPEGSRSACPSPGLERERSGRRRKTSSFAKDMQASPALTADESPPPPPRATTAASSTRPIAEADEHGASPSTGGSNKRSGKAKPGEWGVVL